jgi:hypothetical protein
MSLPEVVSRRQLIIDHFMFDPDWEDGCSSRRAARAMGSPRARAGNRLSGRVPHEQGALVARFS